MTVAESAALILQLVVLGLAGHRCAVLVVKDWVPFAGVREWIWRRHPPVDEDLGEAYRRYALEHGADAAGAVDGDTLDAYRERGTKLGYLLTCQSCAGVWLTGAWWAAWRLWPTGTLLLAAAPAAMAVQRTVGVWVDLAEDREQTVHVAPADPEE